jgi:hypothetical protein
VTSPASARAAAAAVIAAGVALLAVGCGGSHRNATAGTSAASTQPGAALAFSRCMRSHGVPSFPDPDPQGNIPPFDAGVSKQASAAATSACKRLLPRGGGDASGSGDKRKLALALAVARCMRGRGFPTYPDPPGPAASSQGSGTRFDGTGIDTKSPRFQTAETACEKQARKALGLP